MSVVGGILLFTAGIIVGGGLVIYHRTSIQTSTSSLRHENEHLKQSAWRDRLDFETYKAYRKGYYEGRKSPMSDVERLADTLESRHIDFRTVRERPEQGDNSNVQKAKRQ